MNYQRAVFASPTWGARRDSTGEFIEFSSQTDKWVYTWPRQGVQFDYDRLADWAEDMPDVAEAQDWESLGIETSVPLTRAKS